MSYITLYIDGLESFIDLSEYCIIQKSHDCTNKPTIIFHAKHNKDFMVAFATEDKRDDTFDDITESMEASTSCKFSQDADYIEINRDYITSKLKGE